MPKPRPQNAEKCRPKRPQKTCGNRLPHRPSCEFLARAPPECRSHFPRMSLMEIRGRSAPRMPIRTPVCSTAPRECRAFAHKLRTKPENLLTPRSSVVTNPCSDAVRDGGTRGKHIEHSDRQGSGGRPALLKDPRTERDRGQGARPAQIDPSEA